MTTHLANLAVKIGEYEVNGQKKNRYLRIGRVMPGKDGGRFILLDACHISMNLFAGRFGPRYCFCGSGPKC